MENPTALFEVLQMVGGDAGVDADVIRRARDIGQAVISLRDGGHDAARCRRRDQ